MRKIIGVIAFLVTVHASAAEWTFVWNGSNYEYYIDTSSIVTNGSKRKFWSLKNFIKLQNIEGRLYLSQIELNVIDCHNRTISVMRIAAFKGKGRSGEMVFDVEASGKSHEIFPESNGTSAMDFVCKS